jgi:hypothetical protein
MNRDELNSLTVLQLRKLAKENAIVLGAGIDKSGIIEKLLPVLGAENSGMSSGENALPAEETKYQAAWHNTDAPKYSARPAYQAPGAAPRPAWQNTTPSGQHLSHEQQHAQPLRPGSFTPRFGPAASAAVSPVENAEQESPAVPVSPIPEKAHQPF